MEGLACREADDFIFMTGASHIAESGIGMYSGKRLPVNMRCEAIYFSVKRLLTQDKPGFSFIALTCRSRLDSVRALPLTHP